MTAMGVKMVWLMMALALPLAIIFYYEKIKLGIIDVDPIRSKIEDARKHLQIKKNHNAAQIVKLEQWIQNEYSINPVRRQKIKDLIELIKDKPIVLKNHSTYYSTKHVLNIQISSGFLSQFQAIKDQIEYQLMWLHQLLKIPNMSVLQWREDMNFNESPQELILVFREFRMESMDQNIALKIKKGDYRNQYYLKEIVPQLRSLPSFSHCKFTHKACKQNSVIFIKHNAPKERSYWQVDNEIYCLDQADPQTIFNTLTQIFQLQHYFGLIDMVQNPQLVNGIVGMIEKKRQMQKWQKDMDYLDHIMKPYNYSLSPYLHTQEQERRIQKFINFLSKPEQKPEEILSHSITLDSVIGSMDYFPNDFKIGVYLPLLVIFLYPCVIILKQIMPILIAFVRSKRKIEKQQ